MSEAPKLLDAEMPNQTLRLHAGELTAQEIRTARAVIRWANRAASNVIAFYRAILTARDQTIEGLEAKVRRMRYALKKIHYWLDTDQEYLEGLSEDDRRGHLDLMEIARAALSGTKGE